VGPFRVESTISALSESLPESAHQVSEPTSSDNGCTISSITGEEYGAKNSNSNSSDSSDLAVSSPPPKFRLRLPHHHHHHRSAKNQQKRVPPREDSNSDSTLSSLSRESKKKARHATQRSHSDPTSTRNEEDPGTGSSGMNESDECSSSSSSFREQLNKSNVAKLLPKEGESGIESSNDGFLFAGRDEKIVRFRFKGVGQQSSDEDGTVSTLSGEQQQQSSPSEKNAKKRAGAEIKSHNNKKNRPMDTTGKAESSHDSSGISSHSNENQVTESEYASSSASGGGTPGIEAAKLPAATDSKKRKADPPDNVKESIKRQKKADAELKADENASLTTPEGQLAKNPGITAEQACVAAKREYNRRNAMRARKRAKGKMEDLQQQALSLKKDVSKLRETNDQLQAKLATLKEQNRDLIRIGQEQRRDTISSSNKPPSSTLSQSAPPAQFRPPAPRAAAAGATSSSLQQLLISALETLQAPKAPPPPQPPMDQLSQLILSALQAAAVQQNNQQQRTLEQLLLVALSGASNVVDANNNNQAMVLNAILNLIQQRQQGGSK